MMCLSLRVSGQNSDLLYVSMFDQGNYRDAMDTINSRLYEIYGKRVSDKRVPSDFVSIEKTGDEADLIALFRNRKEKGFFIEDNPELADLHLYAGKCSMKLGKKRDSLNHYVQSLRFRRITTERDDEIYYQISQIFKSMNNQIYFKGYVDALEQAYALNSRKYEYSYELGLAMYPTTEKKKAIYHLERYLSLSGKTDADILLKLANLYESIGNYLNAEKYYNEYLRLNPDDVNAIFGAGYIAYYRTGNYTLAEFMFQGVLQKGSKNDTYRLAKSNEYLGDMSYSNLRFDKAIRYYIDSTEFHHQVEQEVSAKEKEKAEIDNRVNDLKMNIINNKDSLKYDDYKNLLDEYEGLLDEQGEKDSELQLLKYNLKQLCPGKVQWNIALCYHKKGDRAVGMQEKKDNYTEAIKYYREAMRDDYNTDKAREIILKLQLKIKRGY
ncbi:MAG TPA: tetratricopeptide repeat protein [Spirochaetota bacterium]|nr:tetratricopeptide repeat protein [Spirochaetota bacterium]